MIVTPYSRRLRLFSVFTAFSIFAIYYVHVRPAWRERTYGYARDIRQTVSKYLATEDVYNNTLYQEGNEATVTQYHNFSDPCAGFPNTDGVQLVMKTGATEAFDRIPTHLLTSLQCLPDFIIFSDMVCRTDCPSVTFRG